MNTESARSRFANYAELSQNLRHECRAISSWHNLSKTEMEIIDQILREIASMVAVKPPSQGAWSEIIKLANIGKSMGVKNDE